MNTTIHSIRKILLKLKTIGKSGMKRPVAKNQLLSKNALTQGIYH
jgi:hypothetical protein